MCERDAPSRQEYCDSKERQGLEDSVRQCREDVRREVEVGCCVLCYFVIVLFRSISEYMAVTRDHTMMVGRCVY